MTAKQVGDLSNSWSPLGPCHSAVEQIRIECAWLAGVGFRGTEWLVPPSTRFLDYQHANCQPCDIPRAGTFPSTSTVSIMEQMNIPCSSPVTLMITFSFSGSSFPICGSATCKVCFMYQWLSAYGKNYHSSRSRKASAMWCVMNHPGVLDIYLGFKMKETHLDNPLYRKPRQQLEASLMCWRNVPQHSTKAMWFPVLSWLTAQKFCVDVVYIKYKIDIKVDIKWELAEAGALFPWWDSLLTIQKK